MEPGDSYDKGVDLLNVSVILGCCKDSHEINYGLERNY